MDRYMWPSPTSQAWRRNYTVHWETVVDGEIQHVAITHKLGEETTRFTGRSLGNGCIHPRDWVGHLNRDERRQWRRREILDVLRPVNREGSYQGETKKKCIPTRRKKSELVLENLGEKEVEWAGKAETIIIIIIIIIYRRLIAHQPHRVTSGLFTSSILIYIYIYKYLTKVGPEIQYKTCTLIINVKHVNMIWKLVPSVLLS